VRTWLTHSVLSAAPGLRQVATPFSSSKPTVFSHRRRPTSALASSSTTALVMPDAASALRDELLSTGTTVSLAQLASAFQIPHPPVSWRVQPVSA
jgi:hypothetical protein